jgi:dTMP kinase
VIVVLEGIDGSGKTTCTRLLANELRARGRTSTILGPFIGSFGTSIKHLFMNTEDLEATVELHLLASAMLRVAEAARASTSAVTLLDRWIYSTYAYHGGGLGVREAEIDVIYASPRARLQPDLVILLDVSIALARERKTGDDRVERWDDAFFERVRARYGEMAARDHWVSIDGSLPAWQVAHEALRHITTHQERS